jgi:prevent-host-death family protein
MAIRSEDIVPLNKLRASFTALAEEVRAGREKIITRNGESYVALVDARQLDRYHQLESAQLHLTLLDDAVTGLEDIHAGRTVSLAEFRRKYRRR